MHPNAIPDADLPGLIAHHIAAYERLLAKDNANRADLICQAHHEAQARELEAERAHRVRKCSGLELVA